MAGEAETTDAGPGCPGRSCTTTGPADACGGGSLIPGWREGRELSEAEAEPLCGAMSCANTSKMKAMSLPAVMSSPAVCCAFWGVHGSCLTEALGAGVSREARNSAQDSASKVDAIESLRCKTNHRRFLTLRVEWLRQEHWCIE